MTASTGSEILLPAFDRWLLSSRAGWRVTRNWRFRWPWPIRQSAAVLYRVAESVLTDLNEIVAISPIHPAPRYAPPTGFGRLTSADSRPH